MAEALDGTGRSGSRLDPRLDQLGLGAAPRRAATATTDPAADRARRETILFWFFAVEIVGVTFLQKFGYGSTAETTVPLLLPMMLLGIGTLLVFIRPVFDPIRFALFAGVMLFAVVSNLLQQQVFSFASFALFLLLYLPLVVSFPIQEATYRRCLNLFSGIMVVMACILFAQHAIQILADWRLWPNLNKIIPEQFLIPNYTYTQKVEWGGKLMKPQAIFFLEVSFCSQFLALALACEVLFFHRLWRIGLFAAAIFASFSGTGLLLLVLTLPVLLGRLSARNAGIIIAGLVVIVVGAIELGWVDAVSRRFNEYQHYGSSSNFRFIEPWNRLVLAIQSPNALFVGIGPGHMEKTTGYQWWPITKAAVEYGFLMAFCFMAFILYVLFRNPPARQLAFMLFIWFSIEGALLTEVNVATLALFCTLFVIDPESRARRPRKRRSGSSAPLAAGGTPQRA